LQDQVKNTQSKKQRETNKSNINKQMEAKQTNKQTNKRTKNEQKTTNQ
jgi:hypothetical protein